MIKITDETSDEPVTCTCTDCGKTFRKGDEGDNETVCLRCEAVWQLHLEDPQPDECETDDGYWD